MRKIWTVIGATIALYLHSPAIAHEKPAFLVCDGFHSMLNEKIRHIAEIYKDGAIFDGQDYFLTADNTFYHLIGPNTADPGTANVAASHFEIVINRLDGSYVKSQISGEINTVDWSRGDDKGCFAARRKF